MTLHGIKDTSPAANVIAPVTMPFNADNIVYTLASAKLPDGRGHRHRSAAFPCTGRNWTMNCL